MNSLFLLILMLFLAGGCGTDTGNPFSESEPSYGDIVAPGDPFPGEEPFTYSLLKASCRKISRCNSEELSYNQCLGYFYELTTVDTEIGLTVGQYTNLQAVLNAENSNELTLNVSATETCVEEFEALDCDDTEIINSYQPSETNPLIRLNEALSNSCTGVF